MTTRPAARRRILPGSPFNTSPALAAPSESLEVDDRVTHDRYGLGRVVRVELSTVFVDFGDACLRRVTLPSAKLTKL